LTTRADPSSTRTELAKTKKDTDAQLAAEKEANQKQFETITSEATKKLSESEKHVSDLTDQLKSVSAQMERLTTERDAAQSNVEATDDELAKAKEATEQATARVTALESAGANTAKDAEAERSKLQAALDEANAEIERLRSERDQQKAIPPEQSNSVLQPPPEASPSPGQ
jgi:chromosome segregation ATPase